MEAWSFRLGCRGNRQTCRLSGARRRRQRAFSEAKSQPLPDRHAERCSGAYPKAETIAFSRPPGNPLRRAAIWWSMFPRYLSLRACIAVTPISRTKPSSPKCPSARSCCCRVPQHPFHKREMALKLTPRTWRIVCSLAVVFLRKAHLFHRTARGNPSRSFQIRMVVSASS